MAIRQLYQKDHYVQTQLAVKVNGIRVTYRQLDGLKFKFDIFGDVPLDDARAAVKEIVSAMEGQSFDHGAQWRRTSIEEEAAVDPYKPYHSFTVSFRVRDSY